MASPTDNSDTGISVTITADFSDLQRGMTAGTEVVQTESAAMTEAVTAAATEMAAVQKMVGESAEEAGARIRSMVQASMEAARADMGLAESERSLAERMGLRIEATEAQLDATAAAIAAQNAQMTSVEGLTKAEDATAFAATGATVAIEENTVAMTVNAGVSRELGTMLGEGLAGNFGRIRQSGAALANQTGLLSYAFTPLGLSIGAAAGAVLVYADNAYKGILADEELNQSLISTAQACGLTRDELRQLAGELESTHLSARDAEEAVNQLAASGRFTAEQLEAAAQAAADMATVTGRSMDQCVEAVMRLQDNPVQAARALNEEFHYLTLAQLDEIQSLQETGNKADAMGVALNQLAATMSERAPQVVKQTNLVKQAWEDLGLVVDGVVTRMSNSLRDSTIDEQIAKLRGEINTLTEGQGVDSGSDIIDAMFARDVSGDIAQKEHQIELLEQKKKAEEDAAHAQQEAARIQQEGADAAKAYDAQFAGLDRQNLRIQKTIELEHELEAIHRANPNDERVRGIEFDPMSGAVIGGEALIPKLAEINKRYQDIDTTTSAQHKAETEAERERKQAMAEELNGLLMQRAGTAANTAERIQADAAVLQSATRLYGAMSTQQKAALNQLLEDEKAYDHSVLQAREETLRAQHDQGAGEIETKKAQYEADYQAGSISASRLLQLERQLVTEKLALDLQYYRAKEALDKNDALALERDESAAVQAKQKANQAMLRADQQYHRNLQTQWRQTATRIEGAMAGAMNSVIFQGQTLKGAMMSVAETIAETFIQKAIAWAAEEVTQNTLVATTKVETQGTAARLNIASDAATAAAGAFSATAAIPYVGPILAPAAATAAYAETMAFQAAVPSAAGGWGRVPEDTLANIHKDEMVLPADLATGIRSMIASGNGGGGGNPHVTINATDSRSVKELFRRENGSLAKAMQLAARRGHFGGKRF